MVHLPKMQDVLSGQRKHGTHIEETIYMFVSANLMDESLVPTYHHHHLYLPYQRVETNFKWSATDQAFVRPGQSLAQRAGFNMAHKLFM